jgi:hypothetical protein
LKPQDAGTSHVFDSDGFPLAFFLLELLAEDVYLYGNASTFCLNHTSKAHYVPSPVWALAVAGFKVGVQ